MTALVGAALVEGATLIVPDPISRWDVLRLVRTAEMRQQSDPRYIAELAYWTARRDSRSDGVPEAAFGPRSEPSTVPLRDFGLVHAPERPGVKFEADPTIAVLYSRADNPIDWLIAGQALQRVLLTTTTHGVATTLLTQPVEIPALRRQLAAPNEPHYAHAVLRRNEGFIWPDAAANGPAVNVVGAFSFARVGIDDVARLATGAGRWWDLLDVDADPQNQLRVAAPVKEAT